MSSTFPWLSTYIAFNILSKCFSCYLDYRQWKHISRSGLPECLKKQVTPTQFSKSVAYSKDKLIFSEISSLIAFGIHLYIYLSFVYVKLWAVACNIFPGSRYFGLSAEYYQSVVFLGMMVVIEEVMSLPFQLYYDFVLEAKHGFNRKTLSTFVTDKLKMYMIEVVVGIPVVWVIIYCVLKGGKQFYLIVWVFMMCFSLIMMIVYPNFIAPLFNNYEPLKDQALVHQIEALAQEHKFPLRKIYQIDASKRSAHSNAYFYGFWWIKYIVLYDTLLDLSHDQILAILAHELGHWKLNHLVKNLMLTFANLFFTFYFFGIVFFNSSIYQSFGFAADVGRPVIIGLVLFMSVYEPVMFLVSILMTVISRTFEFQADAFAAKLGKSAPLQQALIALNSQNLSTFTVDSLYAWFHYDHPHLIERLEYIETVDKRKQE